MKKLLCLLLCAATITVFGQGSTLYRVNVVKPKAGMQSAFEDSWKLHLAKFHNATDKRMVSQIIDGPMNGAYVIAEGPISYADMDKVNPTAKEHNLDLEKTFTPKLEVTGMNSIYRWADTLSYNGNVKADKFLVTVTVYKNGTAGEIQTELRRNVLITTKMNSTVSVNVYVKQFSGSSPTIVNRRGLKDGFKELDNNFSPNMGTQFKDTYIKDYGQDAWDKRLKLLVDDVVSREQHMEKARPDMSSK
ncbi:MAG: hypothetical protein ABIO79_16985 [Ferruginibacter sp.]